MVWEDGVFFTHNVFRIILPNSSSWIRWQLGHSWKAPRPPVAFCASTWTWPLQKTPLFILKFRDITWTSWCWILGRCWGSLFAHRQFTVDSTSCTLRWNLLGLLGWGNECSVIWETSSSVETTLVQKRKRTKYKNRENRKLNGKFRNNMLFIQTSFLSLRRNWCVTGTPVLSVMWYSGPTSIPSQLHCSLEFRVFFFSCLFIPCGHAILKKTTCATNSFLLSHRHLLVVLIDFKILVHLRFVRHQQGCQQLFWPPRWLIPVLQQRYGDLHLTCSCETYTKFGWLLEYCVADYDRLRMMRIQIQASSETLVACWWHVAATSREAAGLLKSRAKTYQPFVLSVCLFLHGVGREDQRSLLCSRNWWAELQI